MIQRANDALKTMEKEAERIYIRKNIPEKY